MLREIQRQDSEKSWPGSLLPLAPSWRLLGGIVGGIGELVRSGLVKEVCRARHFWE
jgi:hypothetical protein